METNIIHQGDALEVLKTLPSESINCSMSSPPYWALRDYGVEGQLGLEKTFEEYINNLCDIYDQVKRVLKEDGCCFVNLGDTYCGGHAGGSIHFKGDKAVKCGAIPQFDKGRPAGKLGKTYTEKCLISIPARFQLEMINRGWILRNVIIWHKPNCMPSSVKDRFTVDFEYIIFFVKSKKYWFDLQREPLAESTVIRNQYGWHGTEVEGIGRSQPQATDKMGDRWGNQELGRSKRTVWKISPKPFPEAHFAVYPEELCETPLKSGCPEGGIVLDPFFGSGTTGLVALKQNKKFIGIELNKEYIEIANRRLKPYLEQNKLGEYYKND